MALSKNSLNIRKKSCNRNCCVMNCFSNVENNPGVHFYGFPSRPWAVERKETWIRAVRRRQPDGKLWRPTAHSKICSNHFRGGMKCNDPANESFNPTIFPKIYKKNSMTPDPRRGERLRAWKKKIEAGEINLSNHFEANIFLNPPASQSKPEYRDFECQTEPILNDDFVQRSIPVIFSCW